jgi:hypothetical protein
MSTSATTSTTTDAAMGDGDAALKVGVRQKLLEPVGDW